MDCMILDQILIVPEGTVKIGYRDLYGYISSRFPEEIILPSTLEIIEDDTFLDFNVIKRIHLPAGLKKIGAQAFWGLDQLEELVIPNTVECVKKHAFCNMPRCKLVICREPPVIPDNWDREFAANVKEISFATNLK